MRRSGVVSIVFVPNTWPNARPIDKMGNPILGVDGGIGGKSGPATSLLSARQTAWARGALGQSKIDIVRSGGIMNAHDIKHSFKLGAVASAGATFYYESLNGWSVDTDKMLSGLTT